MFMQMIDIISISNGQPAMAAPLTFVVILSMIKDGFEDYKRHKEDKSENQNTTDIFNREEGKFESKEWREVQVGDIVKVKDNQFFPADVVVLNSSEPEGAFYVETKNLDGETNLKLKSVAKDLIEPFRELESFKIMD